MKLQLWSYNYDPEPLGIAPVSRVWARAMAERGHEVQVVAAHPHYPKPDWGWRLRPYRERRDGIPVVRLPLIPGRDSGARRMLQEVSFTVAQTLSAPFLRTPEVLVAVSPSFPALLPAMMNARGRRIPWVLWIKDILPDGAAATGYLSPDSRTYRLMARYELAAYRSADAIVVLSETFKENLLRKGVPEEKIARIYDPATRPLRPGQDRDWHAAVPRLVCIGNIGKSQDLASAVRAFEAHEGLRELGARLAITGTGVAADEVRASITTDRVEMKGLLSDAELERELDRAALGLVTQRYAGGDFNVPSKVMNYMGAGLPVLASVDPKSEVSRLLAQSGAGWATSSPDHSALADQAYEALTDPGELERRGRSAREFASKTFSPGGCAEEFERVLMPLVG